MPVHDGDDVGDGLLVDADVHQRRLALQRGELFVEHGELFERLVALFGREFDALGGVLAAAPCHGIPSAAPGGFASGGVGGASPRPFGAAAAASAGFPGLAVARFAFELLADRANLTDQLFLLRPALVERLEVRLGFGQVLLILGRALRRAPAPVMFSRSRISIAVCQVLDAPAGVLDRRRACLSDRSRRAQTPCPAGSRSCPAVAGRRCSGATAAPRRSPPRRAGAPGDAFRACRPARASSARRPLRSAPRP